MIKMKKNVAIQKFFDLLLNHSVATMIRAKSNKKDREELSNLFKHAAHPR